MKSIEADKRSKQNEIIGERLMKKSASVNFKAFARDYDDKKTVKKHMHNFKLPFIECTGPKILKRKMDLSPYNRGLRMQTLDLEEADDQVHITNPHKTISNHSLAGHKKKPPLSLI